MLTYFVGKDGEGQPTFHTDVSVERCSSPLDMFHQTDRLSHDGTSKTIGACSLENTFSPSKGFFCARYQI